MKEAIFIDGAVRDLRDVMNPPGMFLGGKRQREYSAISDPLPLSGKLIPEFFGRRSIRDMFARKLPLPPSQSNGTSGKDVEVSDSIAASQGSSTTEVLNGSAEEVRDSTVTVAKGSPSAVGKKRSAPALQGSKSTKRGKPASAMAVPPVSGKGQQSLKGFFKASATLESSLASAIQGGEVSQRSLNDDGFGREYRPAARLDETYPAPDVHIAAASLDSAFQTPRKLSAQDVRAGSPTAKTYPIGKDAPVILPQASVHDPLESKESWSKIFTKPAAPRCEGHDEPCISLLTKKPGMNLGRSFWMCSRPLGPSGAKEKNTQWRCQTFIWCSDWNPNATNG